MCQSFWDFWVKRNFLPTPSYKVSQNHLPPSHYLCDVIYEWSIRWQAKSNCQKLSKIVNELMNTLQNLISCDWKVTKFNMSWDFFVSLLLKCWMCQKQILSKKTTCVKMKVSMSNQTDVSITRIILKVDYFHLNQSLFNKCLSLFFALRVRTFFL